MKKLAFLVMILALATFVAAPPASAEDREANGIIHGQYAVIATGTCLHSSLGFHNASTPPSPPAWVPNAGAVVWGAPVMAQGIFTFEPDGTGHVSVTNYVTTFPPFDPFATPLIAPGARQAPVSFSFTYDVTDDGVITVTQPTPLGPLTLLGMISNDHKTLTLGNTNQVQPAQPAPAVCNVGRVLIRLKEGGE